MRRLSLSTWWPFEGIPEPNAKSPSHTGGVGGKNGGKRRRKCGSGSGSRKEDEGGPMTPRLSDPAKRARTATSSGSSGNVTTPKMKKGDRRSFHDTPRKVLDAKDFDPVEAERCLYSLISHSSLQRAGEDEITLNLIRRLLTRGTDPNGSPELWKRYSGSPLHLACRLECPKVVDILLEAGGKLTLSYEGATALEWATRNQSCLESVIVHIRRLEASCAAGEDALRSNSI